MVMATNLLDLQSNTEILEHFLSQYQAVEMEKSIHMTLSHNC
jgi:hypothetical protein